MVGQQGTGQCPGQMGTQTRDNKAPRHGLGGPRVRPRDLVGPVEWGKRDGRLLIQRVHRVRLKVIVDEGLKVVPCAALGEQSQFTAQGDALETGPEVGL